MRTRENHFVLLLIQLRRFAQTRKVWQYQRYRRCIVFQRVTVLHWRRRRRRIEVIFLESFASTLVTRGEHTSNQNTRDLYWVVTRGRPRQTNPNWSPKCDKRKIWQKSHTESDKTETKLEDQNWRKKKGKTKFPELKKKEQQTP